jgi:hypothetical protein
MGKLSEKESGNIAWDAYSLAGGRCSQDGNQLLTAGCSTLLAFVPNALPNTQRLILLFEAPQSLTDSNLGREESAAHPHQQFISAMSMTLTNFSPVIYSI